MGERLSSSMINKMNPSSISYSVGALLALITALTGTLSGCATYDTEKKRLDVAPPGGSGVRAEIDRVNEVKSRHVERSSLSINVTCKVSSGRKDQPVWTPCGSLRAELEDTQNGSRLPLVFDGIGIAKTEVQSGRSYRLVFSETWLVQQEPPTPLQAGSSVAISLTPKPSQPR
jgi:hypothetical protein